MARPWAGGCGLRAALRVGVLVLVACGAHARPVEDDDDIGDGSDGDADSDPGGDADADLDLGPEARPSDYPEANDWVDTDPSTLGEGEPCCELVGGAVQMDDDQTSGGPPDVAWSGGGWGVLWGGQDGLTFRALDELGIAAAPPVVIDGDATRYVAIASAEGRYGVVASSSTFGGALGRVGIIDAAGSLLAGVTNLNGEVGDPDIARYSHGNGWIEVHRVRGDSSTDYDSVWVGDDAVAGDPVRIERTADGGGGAPRVVGLRSLASFVWASADGVWSRSVAWPDTDAARPAWRVLQMATSEDTILAAAAYRDSVAVAGVESTLQLALLDPWADEVVAGPTVLADDTYYDAGGPGIAPVEELGYLGVCYAITGAGPDGGTGLVFALVGPDADPWGERVTITTGQRNIGGCAAAWSGVEFLVAWWQSGGDAGFNTIFVQRVVPRL